jgi:glycosyltransferase involved in cell wall biosynthesis
MNILLIPNNDWINHPVPAQRHYQLFERLGRKHNVCVIQFDIFKRNERPTHDPKNTRLIRAFTVHVSDPAQFYMANLVFQGKKIFSAMKELDIEIVFGSNLAVCTLGFEAAKLTGAGKIFDLSDFFPASVNAYYPEMNRMLAYSIHSFASLVTNYNIRTADLCTTCSAKLKEYSMRVAPNTCAEHLPNGVDTKVFIPKSSVESLKNNYEIEDNVLVYVGSIESWLDFDIVFDAINILKREGIKIQLIIIGRSIYSERENPLIRKIVERGLEQQVKFIGYQPYTKLPDFINAGIGGLIPFRTDSLLTQMAFPNKLLEYLACGKPVFAPPMRELEKVGGKYLLTYTSPKSLALQIKRTLSSSFDPQEVRRSVFGYDWNDIADRLEVLMQGLLK